jgi:hypothetical protein
LVVRIEDVGLEETGGRGSAIGVDTVVTSRGGGGAVGGPVVTVAGEKLVAHFG